MGEVIRNCYSAVEGIARNLLGNERTLDNNKDELLAKINLSSGWKSLLASYINYAHNYRHASLKRHDVTKQEAEAYLYMTGLIIRLVKACSICPYQKLYPRLNFNHFCI